MGRAAPRRVAGLWGGMCCASIGAGARGSQKACLWGIDGRGTGCAFDILAASFHIKGKERVCGVASGGTPVGGGRVLRLPTRHKCTRGVFQALGM